MKKILLLSTISLFALFAVSCDAKAKEDTTSKSIINNEVTLVVSEVDDLLLYKPVSLGGLELCCGYDVIPLKDTCAIFFAAAAYTKVYDLLESRYDIVAGPYLDNGYFEGYECPANSGAFYFIPANGRWGFVRNNIADMFQGIASANEECTGFCQVMLLYNGEECSISHMAKPAKRAIRRALCELNNELYVIDSKNKLSMYKFAERLRTLGVSNALYMDMGSMRYSAYREYDGGEWVEIHPRNRLTKYCSNYLVFYR